MASEFVTYGDFFDLTKTTGALPIKLAALYFRHLLAGLSQMHRSGYVHLDIKPENLLLDHQFNLKIADLGGAQPISGQDG